MPKRALNTKPRYQTNIDTFLGRCYIEMSKRVRGVNGPVHKRHCWLNKPIMARGMFVDWAKTHPDFLKLFKKWKRSGNDKRLVPYVNLINSDQGYALGNVEWVTISRNSALSTLVRLQKKIGD